MSDNHSEEHGTFIKTPKQLIIVVVLAFVVPVAVIIALAKLASSGTSATGTDDAAREEAIARNLKPAGMVVVDPNAPPPVAVATPAATSASAPAAAASGGGGGKALYDTSCAACHGAGVAGAPKAGDKAAWAPRLKSGLDGLTASVIKGKGAMPPKGGAMAASDADIKAAVDYLIGLAK